MLLIDARGAVSRRLSPRQVAFGLHRPAIPPMWSGGDRLPLNVGAEQKHG